jgi:microcystin-dependent protein
MANLVTPNTFAANTLAQAAQVNANFAAIETFVETEVVHRDASIAFTAVPSGPGTDPSSANHLARKAYVDASAQAAVLAGSVVETVRTVAPAGWLFLDGATVTNGQSLYPALWAVIPVTWQSGANIVLPDARGRMTVGYNPSDASFDAIGELGGAKTVTIATANLPAHSHTGTTNADSHSHALTAGGSVISTTSGGGVYAGGIGGTATSIAADSHSHTFTTGNTGSGTALSVMNPYITLNRMIRAY